MSAELTIGADGKANMFSVGETPWHRDGDILLEAPSLDSALEIMDANYTVERRPVMFGCVTDDGDTYAKTVPGAFVTVRTDTNVALGVVGATYRPVQNADAFRVLEPLLDTGVAKLETGGTLRDGADAWLMVRWDVEKFGKVVRQAFGDGIIPFGLMATNHNGRRGVLLMDTAIRVVCANTLGFAENSHTDRKIVVKHSSMGMDRVTEAAMRLWHNVISRYETLADQYNVLQRTMLTAEQFDKLVCDTVAPRPQDHPKFNPEAARAELVMARAESKRDELRRMWTQGKGHDGTPSAWYAYNAVVESLDHNRDLWPNRGGVKRTGSLMYGELKELKDKTLAKLLKVAA